MPVLTLPAGQLLNGWLDEIDTEATWEQLARKQSDGTFGSLTTAATVEEGDCLAMLDRSNFAEDFKRRIFVVFDSDAAYIFDEVGGVPGAPNPDKSFVSRSRVEYREFSCNKDILNCVCYVCYAYTSSDPYSTLAGA